MIKIRMRYWLKPKAGTASSRAAPAMHTGSLYLSRKDSIWKMKPVPSVFFSFNFVIPYTFVIPFLPKSPVGRTISTTIRMIKATESR